MSTTGLLVFLAALIFAGFAGPAAGAEFAKSANAPKKIVVPFDFVSRFDNGRYGQMLADSIWKKLDRMKDFVIPEMQDVREVCEVNKIRLAPDTPLEKVGEVVRRDFEAQVGIWGSIERAPGADVEIYDLSIRCVDFSGPQPQVIYEKLNVRTSSVSEVPHVYVREMLEKLSGRTIPLPQTKRLYATGAAVEQRWQNGRNLIGGGDFETAVRGVPKGWEPRAGQLREPLGNLVKWVQDEGNPSNHVVRFSFPAVVGDNEGVMYYSNEFPVEAGAVYRFQVRWRTDGPAVKVFIKCYDEEKTEFRSESPGRGVDAGPSGSLNAPGGRERREVYRSQQNLYGPKNTWNVQTEDFTPKHQKYTPQWGRVMLYAYMGAGTVGFDDVVLKQVVPSPLANVAGEKRHSAASKVTLKEMEENERRGKEARQKLRDEDSAQDSKEK
jgi:hypothetical protein